MTEYNTLSHNQQIVKQAIDAGFAVCPAGSNVQKNEHKGPHTYLTRPRMPDEGWDIPYNQLVPKWLQDFHPDGRVKGGFRQATNDFDLAMKVYWQGPNKDLAVCIATPPGVVIVDIEIEKIPLLPKKNLGVSSCLMQS